MIYRVRRWWRERKRVVGWCEKCNKELRRGQVWEIRSDATDDRRLEIPWGGTSMSAEYCATHAPAEAKRAP